MKYKALISDFDHTLVGNDALISTPVKKAVQKLIQSGYIFSIATGRPYYGKIIKICKELQLKNPVIAHGGAHIVDPVQNKILWQENIKEEEVEKLIAYFIKHSIYFAVEGDNCIYTPDGKRFPLYKEYDTFKKVSELKIKNIPKIIIPAKIAKLSEPRIDAIVKELTGLYKDIHPIKITVQGFFGMDITSARGTKHIATLELMKLLGLKREEVVGVGDGYNDYPLLTACGVKVAMGNAPDELKAIADFIAPNQDKNGLITVINKYFT